MRVLGTLLAAVVLFGVDADAVRANDGIVDAEETVTGDPGDPPPPPECWWSSNEASSGDLAHERGFWRQIDGGDHYDDVLVFFEDGSLHRTFVSEQRTYVLQVRVCNNPDHEEAGRRRWTVVGPPNPTVYWDELTERVTKRVPLPAPNLGVELQPDGSLGVPINLGLWIAVDNPDDVVARAEPAPGIWAETRARLDHIEFFSGTGRGSGECAGAGTPIPDAATDTVAEGPCGYTYESADERGEHTAILRATWTVINTTSTGATERRADIVLDTPIPIDVYEIQTVGTG
ncbi:hypothetical protein [Ilumatobacter sp.]|uniref:hypothetical protein n=1 Tax=Ilumatobacter sp. TaxID=1967498 RepID=UPI003AF8AB55